MEAHINLGLCILSTCILLVGLRQVQQYAIDLPLFVGINYLVAATAGLVRFPHAFHHICAHPVLAFLAAVQGTAFFILFCIMGWMAHKVGLGYMTIVAKMSLVIPVLFSWMYYGDRMTWVHVVGVALALAAILLVNLGEKPKETPGNSPVRPWVVALLSVVLFLGSGASDALFKVLRQDYATLADSREYIIVLFAMAFLASLPVVMYRAARKRLTLNLPTLLSGLALGIPNYFSIVFLAASLKYLDGTVFYPINNTAILLLMTLVSVVAYREKLNAWKVAGLALATSAVVVLA